MGIQFVAEWKEEKPDAFIEGTGFLILRERGE